MDHVILTQEGYEKLKEELRTLKTVKRVEVAKQLEVARSHGDLRENAEYDTAKEAKAQLESRIRTLEEKLTRAKVVDTKDAPTDKVYFGTTVELKNGKTGDKVIFAFVAEDEADISKGKLSISSPIGKALLGHKKGEIVEVRVPAGVVPYEILKISRQ
ncbi:MAG: transcription elongation factor GreA [Candidatus Omnitrophica bacterium]|nr:transcription elongation factor GreA [Candidatus Omnitrophota bacterium]